MKSGVTLVYLEPSMILAYLQKEKGRWPECNACINSLKSGQFHGITSALSMAEVAKPKGGDARTIPLDKYKEMEQFFEYSWLSLVGVDRRVAKRARELVRQYNIRGADAVHLATAQVFDADFLFTYDDDLLDLASQIARPQIQHPFGQLGLFPSTVTHGVPGQHSTVSPSPQGTTGQQSTFPNGSNAQP